MPTTYNGNTLTGNEKFNSGDIINFDYSGVGKPVTLPPGKFKFECWGASGSTVCNAGIGRGAYTKGVLSLRMPQLFYAYVGARGNFDTGVNLMTFNGGGENHNTTTSYSKGGGATDFRLSAGNWNDATGLRNRIMVAGAGAAIGSNGNGVVPHGGELTGIAPNYRIAASTQISGFAFGWGRGGYSAQSYTGAGGGYYGGNSTNSTAAPGMCAGSGSSFISGHPGCNAIRDAGATIVHTAQPNHFSGFVFTETEMLAGSKSMVDPRGVGNVVGNLGHGYARITVVATTYIFIKNDEGIFYYNDGFVQLNKTEDELTREDFESKGILPGDDALTETLLRTLGDSVEILKYGITDELELNITPWDQIIRPTGSIELQLTKNIKQITANDVGNIYRLFSVDDGITWESVLNGRIRVDITGDYEHDLEQFRIYGLTTQRLQEISETLWEEILPAEEENKKIMFLMLLTDDNKTYNIEIMQERYGYYEDMIRGSDYIGRQFVDNMLLKFNRAVTTEVKILFII